MTENTSINNDQIQQEDRKQRYERIGAELRRQRKALSLEQGDVARQLHLPGMVINDIEAGQIDRFSGLYRRGYIRNYARLLELDPDALLAEAGEDVPPELQEVLPVARHGWRLERYLKIATYALVTVAIVPPLVYFFIAGGMRMIDRDAVGEEARTLAQSSESGQQKEGDSADLQEPQPEQEHSTSTAPHVSASALPLNPVRPAQEMASTPVSSVTGPSDSAGAMSGDAAGPLLSALEVELLDDSWVEIHDAEGTRLEYDLLRGGQIRNYQGQPPFRLLVGRSSAVKLQVNGHAVTWEGHDSGDVAEIAVAADGQVQR